MPRGAGCRVFSGSESGLPETPPEQLDGVALEALALEFGTPLHVYSAGAIRQRVTGLRAALAGLDAMICYAVKANGNLALLRLMADMGVGADIVSGGELRRALAAGVPAWRIVFSGVGKREDEVEAALAAGIARFNVESADELDTLQRLAEERETVARAAVRINPDVDARTHAKISTGRSENKFGVGIAEARSWFAESARLTHVRLDGLHMHIGSQVLELEPFTLALDRLGHLWRQLACADHVIRSIDVGGGLGVCYRAGHDRPVSPAGYVGEIRKALHGFTGRIVLEPGRWLVAEAGFLLTRVLRVKEGAERRWLVLDAGMNDLPRPALYDAWHDITPVTRATGPATPYDIVGPVCESSDIFARGRELPQQKPGDLLAIRGTGAYGASMASTYNSRPLAAEVLVDDGRHAVIRRRQSFEEMIAGEVTNPEWQDNAM
ncbi:MAG TPA: diaminopimelate decarboxylase [Woeseiaceae bacterium]|nr:diaminopimelate decarboxylase [Woeseiaceae bacterium]